MYFIELLRYPPIIGEQRLMKQLSQNLKDARMEIIGVAVPVVYKGMPLVRNAYSVISTGTGGSAERRARSSWMRQRGCWFS